MAPATAKGNEAGNDGMRWCALPFLALLLLPTLADAHHPLKGSTRAGRPTRRNPIPPSSSRSTRNLG
jgi:hypothetical protein